MLLTIYPVVESEKSDKPNTVQLSTKWWLLLNCIFKVSVKRIWIIFGSFFEHLVDLYENN